MAGQHLNISKLAGSVTQQVSISYGGTGPWQLDGRGRVYEFILVATAVRGRSWGLVGVGLSCWSISMPQAVLT